MTLQHLIYRRCPMDALVDHVLTHHTHVRHYADQRCAHFANLFEEKKRHKKEEKVSLNASKQRVKSDADAEPYARIRVGEAL